MILVGKIYVSLRRRCILPLYTTTVQKNKQTFRMDASGSVLLLFLFVIGSDNLGMRAVPELKPIRQSHRFTHRVLFQNKIFSKRVITTQNNFDFIMEAMTTRY
jgi:hypothetical protein